MRENIVNGALVPLCKEHLLQHVLPQFPVIDPAERVSERSSVTRIAFPLFRSLAAAAAAADRHQSSSFHRNERGRAGERARADDGSESEWGDDSLINLSEVQQCSAGNGLEKCHETRFVLHALMNKFISFKNQRCSGVHFYSKQGGKDSKAGRNAPSLDTRHSL